MSSTWIQDLWELTQDRKPMATKSRPQVMTTDQALNKARLEKWEKKKAEMKK